MGTRMYLCSLGNLALKSMSSGRCPCTSMPAQTPFFYWLQKSLGISLCSLYSLCVLSLLATDSTSQPEPGKKKKRDWRDATVTYDIRQKVETSVKQGEWSGWVASS